MAAATLQRLDTERSDQQNQKKKLLELKAKVSSGLNSCHTPNSSSFLIVGAPSLS